jgi:hypothetical protein
VLEEKNVREYVENRGGEVVKDIAEQGAKTILHQGGRESKKR